jgi:hypothetical protein
VICSTCKGQRFVVERLPSTDAAGNLTKTERPVPCPTCDGRGVEDCCSGAVCEPPEP